LIVLELDGPLFELFDLSLVLKDLLASAAILLHVRDKLGKELGAATHVADLNCGSTCRRLLASVAPFESDELLDKGIVSLYIKLMHREKQLALL
jgi:hypothetical protein